MATPTTLETATQDRKARLAHLKGLQRKQVPPQDAQDNDASVSRKRKSPSRSPSPSTEVTETYLSGRNYDADARGPRLGFESQPGVAEATVESQARQLAEESKLQQEEEAKQADQIVDLFKLQPKKPTWDLKRHLNKKLEVLNVRTDNAIARIVRERVRNAQKEATVNPSPANTRPSEEQGDTIGMEGATLVEATREMERDEAQEDSDDVSDDDAG